MTSPLNIAIVGDVHGLHHTMVRTLQKWEARHRQNIDVVFQVGDFEPHRHEADLRTMSAPSKYKQLGDFADFFDGRAHYPWPVYFIGGNHEPYGWLESNPLGFELMTNCHYLGRAGVTEVAGLQVAFLTGIYERTAFEQRRPPSEILQFVSNKSYIYFDSNDIDEILAQAGDGVDVLLIHDWPAQLVSDATWSMEYSHLTHRQRGTPGNEPARLLVDLLEPAAVFAGHMHMRFEIDVEHEQGQSQFVGLGHMRSKEDAVVVFEWDGEHLQRLND